MSSRKSRLSEVSLRQVCRDDDGSACCRDNSLTEWNTPTTPSRVKKKKKVCSRAHSRGSHIVTLAMAIAIEVIERASERLPSDPIRFLQRRARSYYTCHCHRNGPTIRQLILSKNLNLHKLPAPQDVKPCEADVPGRSRTRRRCGGLTILRPSRLVYIETQ
jgi:hypothetical protein